MKKSVNILVEGNGMECGVVWCTTRAFGKWGSGVCVCVWCVWQCELGREVGGVVVAPYLSFKSVVLYRYHARPV